MYVSSYKLKKYAPFALIPLLLFIPKILKRAKSTVKVTSLNAVTEIDNDDTISEDRKQHLKNLAEKIAMALGTSYNWFDPRAWYEDDQEAFNLMYGISRSDFDIVSSLYKKTFTNGRDLSADLKKNLDTKYYNKLIVK